jgi:hypothetical protein
MDMYIKLSLCSNADNKFCDHLASHDGCARAGPEMQEGSLSGTSYDILIQALHDGNWDLACELSVSRCYRTMIRVGI